MIVRHSFAVACCELYFAVLYGLQTLHRTVDVEVALRKVLHDSINVLLRATFDGQPLRTSADGGQEVVIPHEPNQGDCRKFQRACIGVGTPDGGCHRE